MAGSFPLIGLTPLLISNQDMAKTDSKAADQTGPYWDQFQQRVQQKKKEEEARELAKAEEEQRKLQAKKFEEEEKRRQEEAQKLSQAEEKRLAQKREEEEIEQRRLADLAALEVLFLYPVLLFLAHCPQASSASRTNLLGQSDMMKQWELNLRQ